MRLVKPSFEIVCWPASSPEVLIELFGRICYKSGNRITVESSNEFVRSLVKRKHWSVIEHVSASVKFVVDRGVSHELVRHRLASFSQESTRYCDYSGGHIEFVIPSWADYILGRHDDEESSSSSSSASTKSLRVNTRSLRVSAESLWALSMSQAEVTYKELRKEGWTPQQARSVLPNSLKTEIVMTANFREWYHVFRLRTSKAAHPQMREVMVPLSQEFAKRCPSVFGEFAKKESEIRSNDGHAGPGPDRAAMDVTPADTPTE